MITSTLALLALGLAPVETPDAQQPWTPARMEQTVYLVKPSETDSRIGHFDEPHRVVFNREVGARAQLAVFLPGTGGKPAAAARLLSVIADQGYRVIGLEYEDTPAVIQVCPRTPAANCSSEFRHWRIFGIGAHPPIGGTGADSIVNRLTKLLVYLDGQHPGEGWGGYLAEGAPDWSRIVISGASQGAGMAAYIAKVTPVARVVLFSGPWDYYGFSRVLAPWLAAPSVTPPERWFGEYHKRENTAALISEAYGALHIPRSNIRVFDLDLPPAYRPRRTENPYHGSTIHLAAYEPEWRFLFGRSQ